VKMGTGAESGMLGALDTTSFQDSLKKLADNLKTAASAAESYTKRMSESEKMISDLIKRGLISPQKSNPGSQQTEEDKKKSAEKVQLQKNSEAKLYSGINKLSDSIDKLSLKISSFKTPVSEKPEQKEKSSGNERILKDVKTILAAVGIGAVVKQITDANIVSPARNTGMLIGSNVISNPTQVTGNLVQNYQQSVAGTQNALATGVGGLIGLIGGPVGAAIGAGVGNYASSTYNNYKLATEVPTFQRRISQDFYANLAGQQPRFGNFVNSQYGGGLGSSSAFLDPYLESKVAFGRSFSRYSNQNLSPGTTGSIINSMSSQGLGGYSDLSSLGSVLGQIAKFTGKTSESTGKVYESLNRTGVNPIEGAERILSMIQSGMSVSQAQRTVQNTANANGNFIAGQQGYFGGSPFQQIQSQLLGQVAGVDIERYFGGDKGEISKANGLFGRARTAISHKNYSDSSVFKSQILRMAGLTGVTQSAGTSASGFTGLSNLQNSTINAQQEALKKGLGGRSPESIDADLINQIKNSTSAFSALGDAMRPVVDLFKEMQAGQGSLGQSLFNAAKTDIDLIKKSYHGVPR